MTTFNPQYLLGIDVGSTTVKAVVVRSENDKVVWQKYGRHETRQGRKLLDFLIDAEAETGISPFNCRVFITGSGGRNLGDLIGAKFVQEVNAVSLVVEKLYPEVCTVIELGGQDAKIIVFKSESGNGRKIKFPSMNDKCAGGTGAVIDKICGKLKISTHDLCQLRYDGLRLHRVAAKCGVFAETDINGLQKLGIPEQELMASLFEAIVCQNLTVLTRGHTLLPHVLLLGGPNTFVRGLQEAWRFHIPKMWEERGIKVPENLRIEDLIYCPQNALYFAALGSIEFGKEEVNELGRYLGTKPLAENLQNNPLAEILRRGNQGLWRSEAELDSFKKSYKREPFLPASFQKGETVRAYVGIDGGSTSTKAVLVSAENQVLCKAYQLSHGNPIQDTVEIFSQLRQQVEGQKARLEVLGVGVTGYAKDILSQLIGADVSLVETVAHTQSALHYYQDPDVIVDVGGQDIKLMMLKDGRVKDFKLNTQCSAGNGYFLQATAESFGVNVEEYANVAFSAQAMPVFGFGCAVFLQSDIVNFQRQGWQASEILAGLASVLPKNVWLYVANIPNLPQLGKRFILQGGTQNNLAAVKAQVDFIRSRFRGSGTEPEIIVHQHCEVAGAIGAAMESRRLFARGHRTRFIGLDGVQSIRYRTTRSEETRCHFCKNRCLRTFIDVQLGEHIEWTPPLADSQVPSLPAERRLIVSSCEKGAVEDVESMREIKAELEAISRANPNLIEMAAREVWRPRHPQSVADPIPLHAWSRKLRRRVQRMNDRKNLRIGIPRVLNFYAYAPLFSVYLESLGIPADHLVYSDYTSDEMYRQGAQRGAIDPCFPSKVAIAHVQQLISVKHQRKPLDCIFFPMFDVLLSPLVNTRGCSACPTVSVTPETVKAAFIKESDVFAEHGIQYVNPLINLSDRPLFARQMFRAWERILGLSEEENERAITAGLDALHQYDRGIRQKARQVLEMLEQEDRLGIVMLGRPYHHDPGINHGVFTEFQKLGYPVFSQNTLPLDEDLLERLFGEEVRLGRISHPLDISDVWKNSNSASSSHKLWAAKFTARHPNLVAVETSSFKCGHDAPIYGVIEEIIEKSGTPYFSFKDIDENKASGAIKLRIETIHYFLRRYQEGLVQRKAARENIRTKLQAYEKQIREEWRIRDEGSLGEERNSEGSLAAGAR